MLAFLLSCAVCVPILGVYHLITRVPVLAILIVIFNVTVGVFAGAMYGWFANRKGPEKPIVWLITGSVITGIVVTTAQFAVAFEAGGFALLGPLWGAMLGGVGAGLYQALVRPGKGKEDPEREDRFCQVIDDQGDKGSKTTNANQDNA
ncbi:MAG: hypothetical protein KAQ74_00170 [Dehalococcoidia bacterium]|nr:hypothetical protein [Dehalococcoidia bacterium]